MATYLDWMRDVFEEAQVEYTPETAGYLDQALRKIAGMDAKSDEEAVYRKIRTRWLNHGLPGKQLLAGFIRDEVYSRRDSPFRPQEGGGYYTNDYQPKETVPQNPR